MAEPMTPATLGPMACISRKLRGVVLLAVHLGDTGCHRDSGDTGRADQRVDLLAGQLAHDVAADQTTSGGDAEGDQAEDDDLEGLELQEVARRPSSRRRTSRG